MKRALGFLTLAALLVGCGGDPEPRALSTSEAERLALVRYTNYEAKIVGVRARVPASGGALVLDGRVDFTEHLGYVALSTEGRADQASTGLVQWGMNGLAFHATAAAAPVEPPPAQGWQLRQLQTSGSELDGVLRVLLNLGADRPENAQLLRQSTARWLRTDEVRGVRVDVLEGPGSAPSRLRYWVDGDGRLHRLEARMGDQQDSAVIDLVAGGAPITVPRQLGG